MIIRYFAPVAFAASLTTIACAPHAGAKTVNWPQPGMNAAHTGFNKAETTISKRNVGHLAQQWTAATQGQIINQPVEMDGMVYINSNDYNLYAVSAATGALIWTYPVGRLPGNPLSIAAGGNLIYAACRIDSDANEGHSGLCALNAKTGALVWQFAIYSDGGQDVDSAPYNGPVLVGGKVFFGESDTIANASVGYAFALDAKTGAVIWQIGNCTNPKQNNCSDIGTPPFAADKGMLFYQTGQSVNQSNICARKQADGSAVWCSGTVYDINQGVAVADGLVLFESNVNGGGQTQLTALSETTGAIVWQQTAPQGTQTYYTPAVAKGLAYFSVGTSGENDIYALSVKTGAVVWHYAAGGTAGYVSSGVTVANGVAYAVCAVADAGDEQCAFDAKTGKVLLSQGGSGDGGPAPIVVNGAEIYVCGANNICDATP